MKWIDKFRKPPVVSLDEIRRSFNEAAADEEHFPSQIDPRIFHVRLLLRYLGDLNGKRVIDVGSGKGRFARVFKQANPDGEFVCFDLAEAMLACVPRDISTCCGSMTALPFPEACFHAAYATESLEHAVDIEAAVDEMCRVVAPGGRVANIDKKVEHWGKLNTPAWAKWFRREELEKLLRRHCSEVRSDFVSYWEDVPPDGLFLAWTGRKYS
ncbi:MAG: class I SAM-dependent methyltransferase [Bryobacteraceae bacterium]